MQCFLIYLFLQIIYMFQVLPPPIIRSTKLYNTAFRYCQTILLLAASVDKVVLYCTVLWSWWWAKEQPETCRESVEINKSRNVASCWSSWTYECQIQNIYFDMFVYIVCVCVCVHINTRSYAPIWAYFFIVIPVNILCHMF